MAINFVCHHKISVVALWCAMEKEPGMAAWGWRSGLAWLHRDREGPGPGPTKRPDPRECPGSRRPSGFRLIQAHLGPEGSSTMLPMAPCFLRHDALELYYKLRSQRQGLLGSSGTLVIESSGR